MPSWLSQFSFAKLRQPTGQTFFLPSQRNFPISLKPKVAITEFFWIMQRKTWYSIVGLDAMPLSLKNLLLNLTDKRDPTTPQLLGRILKKVALKIPYFKGSCSYLQKKMYLQLQTL